MDVIVEEDRDARSGSDEGAPAKGAQRRQFGVASRSVEHVREEARRSGEAAGVGDGGGVSGRRRLVPRSDLDRGR